MIKVFVYGTLKPGQYNYRRYCTNQIMAQQPAITLGKLYDLSVGYPGMVEENGIVQGYLLAFKDDSVLAKLDQLEAYHPKGPVEDNEYYRTQTEIFSPPPALPPNITPDEVFTTCQSLGRVWTYFMTAEKVQQLGGVFIPSGCWLPGDNPYLGR